MNVSFIKEISRMFILNLFRNSDRAVSYEPGQVLFREGERGDCMFVVLEGEIEIRVNDKVIDTTLPGGILGEMALVDDLPRSATAVAKTACKVVPVNERQFNFMVQETPFFAITVMRIMCDRLRKRFPAS
jgi:CRP/FNR family transcriptional regulator, cyclic AMP receptor protein